MYNPFSLCGKTILVTGASSGIGQSTAIECSKMGATVVITGRNEQRLKETFLQLENGRHQMITADITKYDEIIKIADECPSLDGVSHNAGIGRVLPVKKIKPSDLDDILATNTEAPILLTQSLLKKKKINKDASIVFTSSLCGVYCVHYGESVYAASKGALSGFAKGAALELAAQGIRVNCINPSIIQTPLFNTISVLDEEERETKLKNYPIKRLGLPTDTAWAIIYFLSEASTWVTGNNLKIDGGYTLL